MTQNPRLVTPPHDGRSEPHPSRASRGTLGEQLERSAVMVLARMGDSKVLVPLAAAGLEAERSVRRFWDSALTAVYHLYQLPTRREVLVLAEQVSALRHRVAHLEDAARSNPIRTRSHP